MCVCLYVCVRERARVHIRVKRGCPQARAPSIDKGRTSMHTCTPTHRSKPTHTHTYTNTHTHAHTHTRTHAHARPKPAHQSRRLLHVPSPAARALPCSTCTPLKHVPFPAMHRTCWTSSCRAASLPSPKNCALLGALSLCLVGVCVPGACGEAVLVSGCTAPDRRTWECGLALAPVPSPSWSLQWRQHGVGCML